MSYFSLFLFTNLHTWTDERFAVRQDYVEALFQQELEITIWSKLEECIQNTLG